MTDSSVRFQAVPADPSPYLTSVDALEAAPRVRIVVVSIDQPRGRR